MSYILKLALWIFIVIPDAATVGLNGDCCDLVWALIIDAPPKRFIPAEALPIIDTASQTTFFFAKRTDRKTHHVGIIDNVNERKVYFRDLDGDRFVVRERPWKDIRVLSNPRGCVVEWINWNLTNLSPISTAPFEFTSEMEYRFVKKGSNFMGTIQIGSPKGVGFDVSEAGSKPKLDSVETDFQVLAIDCLASLRAMFKAELTDIAFDDGFDGYLSDGRSSGPDEGLKALSMTEVINDSEYDQESDIDLESEVSSALEMAHSSTLTSLVDTSWGVDASVKVSAVWGFISGGVGGQYNSLDVKKNFTDTGRVSHEAEKKHFKFSGKMMLAKRSRNTITVRTREIKGNHKYKAHYRISSPSFNETDENLLGFVQRSFRRQGFADWKKVEKDSKGFITYTVQGEMKIESGIDTHVAINSTPLSGSQKSTTRAAISSTEKPKTTKARRTTTTEAYGAVDDSAEGITEDDIEEVISERETNMH